MLTLPIKKKWFNMIKSGEKIDKIEKYLLNKRKDIHFSHLKNDIKYEIFKIIQDILIIIEGGS